MYKSMVREATLTVEDEVGVGRRVPTATPSRGIIPLLTISTIAWAAQSILARLAYEAGFSPLTLTTSRMLGSCLVLVAVLGLARPRALRVPATALPGLAAYGVVAMALFGYLLNLSIQLVPVAIALVLMYTGPVMMLVLGIPLLRERLQPGTVAAALLAAAGCYLVSGGLGVAVGQLDPLGIAAGLGAGACFAFMGLAGKLALSQRSDWTVMVYGQAFGAAALVLAGGLRPDGLATVTGAGWGLVAVSIACFLPAYWVFLQALKVMSPGRVGIIVTLEPVWTAVLGWLAFTELLTSWQLVGGAMVLGAAVAARLRPPGHDRPGPGIGCTPGRVGEGR